ncbi:MAG: response regulator [Oscillospiraceae bacterium]|nr:response regulator [Oscillospiraceae bacterium]
MTVQTKTIFIVDDNDVNLLTAESALEDLYDVYTLPSAAGMFELLQDIKPHLILLDIIMPEMNGFDAMEKIKSDERYKDISVIFLSGQADVETKARGFKLGAKDFIQKPFYPDDLIRRLKLAFQITVG